MTIMHRSQNPPHASLASLTRAVYQIEMVYNLTMLDRRRFLPSISDAGAASITSWAARSPVKIAHHEANMLRQPSASVYELGASIPGPAEEWLPKTKRSGEMLGGAFKIDMLTAGFKGRAK